MSSSRISRARWRAATTTPLAPIGLGLLIWAGPVLGQSAGARVADDLERTPQGGERMAGDESSEAAGQEGDGSVRADATPRPLAFSLGLGAGRDSGLLIGDAERDDAFYIAAPSLLFAPRISSRAELAVAYRPEIERFERRPELDNVSHAAGALYHYRASRRTRLLMGGSSLNGEDPSRHLVGQLLILPRVPFQQQRLHAGFERRWQRTSMLFQLIGTSTEISTPLLGESEIGVGALFFGLDQTEGSTTLSVDHALSQRTSLTATYSYLHPFSTSRSLGEDGLPSDTVTGSTAPIQTLVLGAGIRPTARLTLRLGGGVLYESGDASYLALVELDRQSRVFSVNLRYDRSRFSLGGVGPGVAGSPTLPLLPTVALPASLAETLSVSMTLSPIERLRWEQRAWAGRLDLVGTEPLDSLGLDSRLIVEVIDRFGLYAQLELFDQEGARLPAGGLSRNRISAGLIIGLSGHGRGFGISEETAQLQQVLPHGRGF